MDAQTDSLFIPDLWMIISRFGRSLSHEKILSQEDNFVERFPGRNIDDYFVSQVIL